MLSYILPVEDKSAGKERLQLQFSSPPSGHDARNGRSGRPPAPPSIISKESSTSSFASSDLTGSSMTPTGTHEKPKHKLLANGTKHTGLKRVSFGSSKGSMVETLIYESPLAEEPEGSPAASAHCAHETSFPYAAPVVASPSDLDAERSKVRVSFYQVVAPLCVSPPPSEENQSVGLGVTGEEMASTTVIVDGAQPHFNRQISTESGWDNPFRPDGDLSREADEIVSLIKGGKPITPTPISNQLPAVDETDRKNNSHSVESPVNKAASPKLTSTPSPKANGAKNGAPLSPGQVEVQRSAPIEPQQAEHIVIKKKPKCKCCVVQ